MRRYHSRLGAVSGAATGAGAVSGMAGDPSSRMFTSAKELLWRQRQIYPFPCDKEEVLCSLFPAEMQDVVLDEDVKFAWENLTHCVSKGTSCVIELDGVTGKAFWMRFDTQVPVPMDAASFTLPNTSPHYSTVYDWWLKAMEIHSELSEYEKALWDFFQRASHPLLVEKYWAELHTFVSFKVLPTQELSKEALNKRRIIPMPSEEHRNGIIETLAASTLLPKYNCTAWVDYEVEDS